MKNPLKLLLQKILPREYDFYSDLNSHADKVWEGVFCLLKWFETRDHDMANRVRALEHEADDIILVIARELGKVFSTPIDREDIHHMATIMDQIINYAKNTVREMEIFDIAPDNLMQGMTELILSGVSALRDAIQALPGLSSEIRPHIDQAVKSERLVEKLYRKSINELFEGDDVKEILKRREIYRHLSNTADRVEAAADWLSLILVKYG